ncbi:MAG: M14 family metallopeptidase [Xanthobacteraceae bacterium]
MAYMNVDEIEAALEALAAAHPGETELILLPNRTAEGRQSHALRIGPADADGANAICFTGGLHAREWVPPDALVNLAADLLEAHARGTGLRYGGQRFSADDIRGVVENLQVVLFPCVNPDGRHHSQSAEPMWRKNRRRTSPGSPCVGVDINRNFDACWDFRRHFAADSHVSASDNPCDPQVYVGPAAASEPETRNVVALFDRYPRLHWFVDVHSYVPAMYFNWGFDVNQTADASMSFRNPAFDGQRGRGGDAYREFIQPDDLQTLKRLGGVVTAAITAADGEQYELEQSFALYPTSGTSDDYAYSRHFAQGGGNGKILGFCIECGRSFQPTWTQAENVIREVCAGLTALCVAVAAEPGA